MVLSQLVDCNLTVPGLGSVPYLQSRDNNPSVIPVNTILEVRHIEPQSLQHTILEFVVNHILTQTDYDMDKIIKIGELLNINFDKYYEIKNYGRPLNIEELLEKNFGGKKLRKKK